MSGKFTYSCSRCGKKITDESYFKYGVQVIKYGYTMLTKPLCHECSEDLDNFLENKSIFHRKIDEEGEKDGM